MVYLMKIEVFPRYGYSHDNWARSPSNKHFTSRYCVLVGGHLVFWKIKEDEVIARSSDEVKYIAMAFGHI